MNRLLFVSLIAAAGSIITPAVSPLSAHSASTNWDGSVTAIQCDQPLPEFTLDVGQQVTNEQAPALCNCLWNAIDKGGWEQETLTKISNGDKPNPILFQGVLGRFKGAVDECSKGKYYLNSSYQQQGQGEIDSISNGTQKILGFLGGGPVGVIIAPITFNMVGGNVTAWILIGGIGGGFLWSIQIGAFIQIFSLLSGKENKDLKGISDNTTRIVDIALADNGITESLGEIAEAREVEKSDELTIDKDKPKQAVVTQAQVDAHETKRQTENSKRKHRQILDAPTENNARVTTTTRVANIPTLNTGIPELDGPGMYQRLTGQGPLAQALYLLYSERHNAYKVGHCKPNGIAARIRQIKPEVSDVKLAGTAVFSSVNNAYRAEQKILEKYSGHKYSGITGRWSGASEWITIRPSGRPYLTAPSKVEEKFERESISPREAIEEPDIYTVYLLRSDKHNKFKVSWCKTTNLQNKIKREQEEGLSDAFLISRFRMANRDKARAIAIALSEEAGSFTKEGRAEIFGWASNPHYLSQFKTWDRDGERLE